MFITMYVLCFRSICLTFILLAVFLVWQYFMDTTSMVASLCRYINSYYRNLSLQKIWKVWTQTYTGVLYGCCKWCSNKVGSKIYIEHMLHTDFQPIYVREKSITITFHLILMKLCCVKKSLFSFIYENVCFQIRVCKTE